MAGSPVTWWRRLGGPNAVSLPAWLITLPGAVLVTFTIVPGGTQGRWLAWTGLGLGAHVLAGAVLLAAWLTVLRPGTRGERPLAYVVVVVAAGAVRGVFLAWSPAALGFTATADYGVRVPAAIAWFTLWFTLATVVVDEYRRHRAAMARLSDAQAYELRLAEESAHVAQAARDEAAEGVEHVVTVQLQHALTLTADPAAAAAHLRHVVDEVIRPLSHEFDLRTGDERRLLASVESSVSTVRPPVSDYVRGAVEWRPFNPLVATAIVAGNSAFLLVSYVGVAAGALTLTVECAAVVIALTVLRDRHRASSPSGSSARRAARILVAWLAVTVGATALAVGTLGLVIGWPDAWPESALPPLPGFLAANVALVLMAQILPAVDGSVAHLRGIAEDRLRDVNRGLDWAASRLRQQSWLERRMLGRILHGDVQARIVSLALRIQVNPSFDIASEIESLTTQVRSGLTMRREGSWRQDLEDVRGLWAGVIDLDISLAHDVPHALDADPVAGTAFVEVVREAITNAVSHGGADRVEVAARRDVGAIAIVVEDDGRGSVGDSRHGLGSQMLDEVCWEWTRTDSRGTRLSATLTCLPAPIPREDGP